MIMGSKELRVLLIRFLLLFSLYLNLTESSTPTHPPCHRDESDALLEFKHSFSINETASAGDPLARPKTALWNVSSSRRGGEGGDCWHCSWDGVECDPSTGRVIGLNLSSSCLYGPIDSTSSVFRLIHLRRLGLGNNDFNNSQVPFGLGRLSRLTHLDLSFSGFSGQIPPQVLQLSKLVSLELSGNPSTMLVNPGLRSLVQNLTSLRELHLTQVRMSSAVPNALANLSSMTSLLLGDCGLRGEFPGEVFRLPRLQSLSLRHNPDLTGSLPEFLFRKGSPLQVLRLANTSFYGNLPDSIGELISLTSLDFAYCYLSGTLPASMANLTRLTYLDLRYNNFGNQTFPSWLGKLSQLSELYLDRANLTDEIPSSLANLTQLYTLSLQRNHLTGQLPHWLKKLTWLGVLNVGQNKLQGMIPDSIFELTSLETLNLADNNLSGMVEMNKLMKLRNLTSIDLSFNKLSVLINTSISSATSRKWKYIGLGSCNLSEFPDFLRGQNELGGLELGKNNIHGPIPKWFWSTGTESLQYLSLQDNHLTEFEEQPVFLPWKRLELISLARNRLKGFLPIPLPSTNYYEAQYNSFTGNLTPQICSLTSLYFLDISNNNLSGAIPPCIWSFSNNLVWVTLRGNNFHGPIPETFNSGNQLRNVDLSGNHLQGQLPRSLTNCVMLKFLDVSNNEINDNFPHWLGILPDLRVLLLKSNRFHGIVGGTGNAKDFPKLHIVDLSHNGFHGNLPAEYFRNWNPMKASNRINSTYMISRSSWTGFELTSEFSAKVIIKGVEIEYSNIPETFTVIDLSSNRFDGAIPKSIKDLKGLKSLNLSNNYLRGPIPPFLGNLTELESLDLSYNNLTGKIPMELAHLTFLAIFNASYNNLSGVIPHGNQFDVFSNTSYLGNLRLCGNPLSKQCGNSGISPPPPRTRTEDTDSGFEFDWVVISMGYVSGAVIGAVIGWTLAAKKHEWFVETFERKQRRPRRRS